MEENKKKVKREGWYNSAQEQHSCSSTITIKNIHFSNSMCVHILYFEHKLDQYFLKNKISILLAFIRIKGKL